MKHNRIAATDGSPEDGARGDGQGVFAETIRRGDNLARARAVLRVRLPARPLDYGAFALVTVGIVGMVAHFWIQDYGGMAWSAATVGLGIAGVGWRTVGQLHHASLP